MAKEIEITICLGSSCFARGNKKTVQYIKTYIEDHNLSERVYFHGGHCFGKCDEGPVVKINKKYYKNVDPAAIIDILANELED